MKHDLETVLLTLNLAEKKVVAAQKAVAGKTGNGQFEHARKQIMQLVGYTHLKGALGFQGMIGRSWSGAQKRRPWRRPSALTEIL